MMKTENDGLALCRFFCTMTRPCAGDRHWWYSPQMAIPVRYVLHRLGGPFVALSISVSLPRGAVCAEHVRSATKHA